MAMSEGASECCQMLREAVVARLELAGASLSQVANSSSERLGAA